jgi:hypothetical protein
MTPEQWLEEHRPIKMSEESKRKYCERTKEWYAKAQEELKQHLTNAQLPLEGALKIYAERPNKTKCDNS